jgi:hypothetical protein
MRIALGVLKWPPSVFWQSTPHEFVAACEGSQGEFGQTKRKETAFQKLYKEVKEADKNGDNN